MKNIIKKWFIPQGYVQLYQLLKKKENLKNKYLEENSVLRNSSANVDRCFILATGPSINDINVSLLKGELCISVSNFFVHPLFNEIKPKYHIFAESHPPITEEQYVNWLKDAEGRITYTANFIVSANDSFLLDKYKVLTKHKTYYYLSGGTYPVDFTSGLPEIQTVVHIAIYLAMYIGVKEIYLVGVDNTLNFQKNSFVHFYKKEEHKMVANGYREWEISSDLEDEFLAMARLWKIYKSIKKNADLMNHKIINLTYNSSLDMFPLRDYEKSIKRII